MSNYQPKEINVYNRKVTYYGEEMGFYVFCTIDEASRPMTGTVAFWELTLDKLLEMAERMERNQFSRKIEQMLEVTCNQLNGKGHFPKSKVLRNEIPSQHSALERAREFLKDVLIVMK